LTSWHRWCYVASCCGCDRQSSEQKCNHNNPPGALFTPHLKTKEKQMKTMKINRKGGFTLVEIMIVVAIIGLLAAIAIPNFIKARTTAQTNACINNLRQIDAAIQQFALETHLAPGAQVLVTDPIGQYLGRGAGATINGVIGTPNSINCPAGGQYVSTTDDVAPTCTKAALGHVLP
jgi:prepilin-type N-terminal cleavage/methylation domain-containing protein